MVRRDFPRTFQRPLGIARLSLRQAFAAFERGVLLTLERSKRLLIRAPGIHLLRAAPVLTRQPNHERRSVKGRLLFLRNHGEP